MERPSFDGRPLTENSEGSMIGYISGELGIEFSKRYSAIVHEKFHDNMALKMPLRNLDDDFKYGSVLKGSNTYSSILAAKILKDIGYRIARPSDIHRADKLFNSNFKKYYNPELRGFGPNFDKSLLDKGIASEGYNDFGLVFRSIDRPNKYYAKQLFPQIRNIVGETKDPIVILSEDLDLINDDKAPFGLGLRIVGSGLIKAPILKETHSDGPYVERFLFIRYSNVDNNGLPIPDNRHNGQEMLYANDSGLFRFYRLTPSLIGNIGYVDPDFYGGFRALTYHQRDANLGNLADSDGWGRILVVSD